MSDNAKIVVAVSAMFSAAVAFWFAMPPLIWAWSTWADLWR